MRRPILYGITGSIVGAAAGTTVGALCFAAWTVLSDLDVFSALPARDGLERWLVGVDIGFIFALTVWAVICGVRIARRYSAPPLVSRKETAALLSWWVAILVPALAVALAFFIDWRHDRAHEQQMQLAKEVAARYNRITGSGLRLSPDNRSMILDVSVDGPKAGVYDLHADVEDCDGQRLALRETLQLPAGKSQLSLTFPGQGEWQHGTNRYDKSIHVWDRQVVAGIRFVPHVSPEEAAALSRATTMSDEWWYPDFWYRTLPPVQVRCSDETATSSAK